MCDAFVTCRACLFLSLRRLAPLRWIECFAERYEDILLRLLESLVILRTKRFVTASLFILISIFSSLGNDRQLFPTGVESEASAPDITPHRYSEVPIGVDAYHIVVQWGRLGAPRLDVTQAQTNLRDNAPVAMSILHGKATTLRQCIHIIAGPPPQGDGGTDGCRRCSGMNLNFSEFLRSDPARKMYMLLFRREDHPIPLKIIMGLRTPGTDSIHMRQVQFNESQGQLQELICSRQQSLQVYGISVTCQGCLNNCHVLKCCAGNT